MEDEAFHFQLTRETYKKYIDKSPIKNRLQTLLLSAQEAVDKIDFVELVGEATKLPYVKGEISAIFNKYENGIHRTLDSQEAIAVGCAIYAMNVSNPNFFKFSIEGEQLIKFEGNMTEEEINFYIKAEEKM